MAETKKSKTIDVVSGSSEPETNRPIIVSRKPIMSDPEFVAQAGEDESMPKEEEDNVNRNNTIKFDPPKEKAEANPKAELKIEPLTDNNLDSPKDEPQAEPASEPEPKPEAKEPQAEPASEPEPKPEANEPKTDSESQSAPPEAKSEAAKMRRQLQQEEENRAHIEKINQLVESERYFLPINMKEKRYNQRVILIGVLICIVLAVVWLDVALDAGIINNSLHLPHTHFFVLKS